MTTKKPKAIKRTERGWAGHLCVASYCRFRRNTLLESGNRRIVVSTVGNFHYEGKPKTIGFERYYETMAFEAMKQGVYWEADVSKQICFNSNWALNECEQETDLKADEMHEQVVKELFETL